MILWFYDFMILWFYDFMIFYKYKHYSFYYVSFVNAWARASQLDGKDVPFLLEALVEFRAPAQIALEAGHDDIVAVVAKIVVQAVERPLAAIAHHVIEDADMEAAIVAQQAAVAQEADHVVESRRGRGGVDSLFLVLVFVGPQLGANLLLHIAALFTRAAAAANIYKKGIDESHLFFRRDVGRPSRRFGHLPHLWLSL